MSNDVAIRVEGLSKKYRIGNRGTHADDLRYRLAGAISSPFRRLFGRNGHSSSLASSDSPLATSFEEIWALKDVSFEVKAGEILGIIGRNGAGKSTLLKILSRITEPTEGRVECHGRLAALLEVGTGFHPELTGRENVYLNGSILGMTKAEIDKQFDAIVDFAGVEKFIDTPVKRYSSGMHVRLGFGVAAHLDPEILLVDEVLAVGDIEFQKKCVGKMREVRETGRTVLFVSHNMASVRMLCDSALVLAKGEESFRGEVDQGIAAYTRSQSKQHVTQSVAARTDRQGSGRLKWTSGVFTDTAGSVVNEVAAGDAVNIVGRFQREPDLDVSKVVFAAGLSDGYGAQVAAFVSDELKTSVARTNNLMGNVVFHIPHLWLRSGRYSLRLFASYGDTDPSSFLDIVENCDSLAVTATRMHARGCLTRAGSYSLIPAVIEVD